MQKPKFFLIPPLILVLSVTLCAVVLAAASETPEVVELGECGADSTTLSATALGESASMTVSGNTDDALALANGVYAILYEDGTLVFQNSNTPESSKTVTKTYAVDLSMVYTGYPSSYAPWYNERESVRVVNFADRISPTATAYWFFNCKKLERVDNIRNLDTANVMSMTSMFNGCSRLTALDLSHFNTANVTDMSNMFHYCNGLTALDLSYFDTANVTGMSNMFYYCSGLTALDVSHFDTANVTNMSNMFCNCSTLTMLDVSHFNTANVTDMRTMFASCSGLTKLDVSHFNTANVTDMYYMFGDCSGLTMLDVSRFDTANVTNMDYMFYACSSLNVLDVSHFNTSKVTDMRWMFYGCSALTALDLSQFDITNVTNMESMFYGCRGLTVLDVSHFNTAKVTNMGGMFYGCSGLNALDMSNFDTANTTDMNCMFYGCSSLTALDMSHFDTANVTSMSSMFKGCSALTVLDVSHFNTANAKYMYDMFYSCFNLKTIYASDKFTTTSLQDSENMFYDCVALVGGNGTTFDSSHTDKEYARIDTASTLGYFTDKDSPAPTVYAIIDVVKSNGSLSVTLTNPAAVMLTVSYFDASGKFVSATMQDVPSGVGTATSVVPVSSSVARVMLFDDAFCPLCTAFGVQVG